jgi:hypothetical protein
MQAFLEGDLDQISAKIRSAWKSGLTRLETDDRRPTGWFAAEGYNENRICSRILIPPVQ